MIVSLCFSIVAMLLTVPLLTLLLQAVAAYFLTDGEEEHLDTSDMHAAILIPAHNEALSITATIAAINEQSVSNVRVVVIADNCSDDTGAMAASAGAEVVTRNDTMRIGKGYALDMGMWHLARTNAPDVVVIIDADCLLCPGSLSTLIEACVRQKAPVQAMYTMAPSPRKQDAQIAEFAWRIKGVLRPIGFMRLDLPCHLKGTGMAFPWSILQGYNLATSHITEDLLLSVELAARGTLTKFCSRASVVSRLPSSSRGRQDQRERWIHGYLSVVRQYLPKLFFSTIKRRDVALFALACDLAVPPLVLLILLCSLSSVASTLWYGITGEILPLVINAANLGILIGFLLLAWLYCGRDLIGRKELALIPKHFGAVLKIIFSYMLGKRGQWNRAERKE